MAVLVNSVEIEAPAEIVFDYASDLSNELEWGEPVRIVQLTEGPPGVGSRFDAEWKGGGPVEVEYVAFDRPRRWKALGRSRKMDVNLAGSVEALTPSRARFTATMELVPHGWFRLLLPLLRMAMQKTEVKNLAALKSTIERRQAERRAS
jgi:uncharacterized protein YndB with AHSA1/START domain